jgi:hypothetical protein
MHWKLNGNANDSIGTNNGSVVGAVPADDGKVLGCYVFNGSSYIVGSFVSQVVKTDNNSVTFWFNASGLSNDFYTLWMNSDSSANRVGVQIKDIDGTKTICSGYFNGAGYTGIAGSWVSNEWIHVAYIQSSTGAIKLFVNGMIQPNVSSTPILSIGGGFRMGVRTDNTDFLIGSIDDFRIYDVVLSDDQVLSIYNNGAGTEDDYYDATRIGGIFVYKK